MWHQLTPADLRRGRHQLNLRRADTLKKHAEETKALRARQAEELHKFDEKHAEIDALETMLDSFASEFKSERQAEACHGMGSANNAAAQPIRCPAARENSHV